MHSQVDNQFARAREVKRKAHDQLVELGLNLLSLHTTVSRFKAPKDRSLDVPRYEFMARERAGKALVLVSNLELTPEQKERFVRAFRVFAGWS